MPAPTDEDMRELEEAFGLPIGSERVPLLTWARVGLAAIAIKTTC